MLKKVKINQLNGRDGIGNAGFTLIEVVLILVLAAGVFMAMYSIFSKTVANDQESVNESIASNLAQEGVEIIKNVRDKNEMNDDDINLNLTTTKKCYPFSSEATSRCNKSNYTEAIEKDSATGKYQNCPATGCTSSQKTIFTRVCQWESLAPDGTTDNEAKAFAASCVVEWTGISGIDRKARAMTILTDWQP